MSDYFVTGQRLGDYEILGVLGAGGMGRVYKVRNVISDRVEAMKVLLGNLVSQKELADRFLREIKVLASLDHPNIAALRTALTLDNQLVMLMEYVDGVTLASRLQSGPIPAADAINYSSQLLSALSYAHKLNVIHRDVKPANMMLTPQGVVKLMDFGIARPTNEAGMTVTGTTLGSLNYISPEQVRGEAVDARSDLYSFGASLYEMVTGQLPFRGNSNFSVMSAHLQELPSPPLAHRPDLPKGLNEIILMAMAKDPRDRFQSADALANALKTVLSGTISPAPSQPTVPMPVAAAPVPRVASAPSAAATPLEPTQPLAASAAAAGSPSPASATSHRGLYMALGGLLVVAILASASVYVPHWKKTHANAGSGSSVQPAAPAVAEPALAPLPTAAPPAPPEAPAATATQPPAAARQQDAAAAQARAQAEQRVKEEAEQRAAALKEAEQQIDQLDSRAAAISQSLDGLRRQQAAAGYGLRGDIAAAEELMKTSLSRAQSALDAQDPAKAKQYLDSAEAQAEKIERFLGR